MGARRNTSNRPDDVMTRFIYFVFLRLGDPRIDSPRRYYFRFITFIPQAYTKTKLGGHMMVSWDMEERRQAVDTGGDRKMAEGQNLDGAGSKPT
ncbi:hypothetical protein SERLA73DRAFT_182981, partial [Serpula lacrymans var. lacrymans S7.3]